MEQYAKIQQILKKEEGQKERKPIYPPTVIQAVFDAKTGASLEAILAQFNSIYVQYQGTPKATRCIIPEEMRRAGLTITYMNMDSETITERAASAVQKDNDHWGLDINWSRVDELSLSGDISVSAQGTWIINGEDTGIKALGPKGDAGLTPWLKTIDNRLHFSYDNVNWEPCSEPIAAYFRFNATSGNTQSGTIGKIQISRDNKTWNDLSPEFTNNLHITGYVATTSALPANKPVGTIYGVGPTYATEDTAQTNPIYRLYVYNGTTWVDNGKFTSIAAGIVQETGDSETEVMSQKATTEKLTELGSEVSVFKKSQNKLSRLIEQGYDKMIREVNLNVNREDGYEYYIYLGFLDEDNNIDEKKEIRLIREKGGIQEIVVFLYPNSSTPFYSRIYALKGKGQVILNLSKYNKTIGDLTINATHGFNLSDKCFGNSISLINRSIEGIDIESLSEQVNSIELPNENYTKFPTNWKEGYVRANGKVESSSGGENFMRTDFLNVEGVDVLCIRHGFVNPYVSPIAFYDKNREYMSSPLNFDGYKTDLNEDVEVPKGAVYAIITSHISPITSVFSNASLALSLLVNKTETANVKERADEGIRNIGKVVGVPVKADLSSVSVSGFLNAINGSVNANTNWVHGIVPIDEGSKTIIFNTLPSAQYSHAVVNYFVDKNGNGISEGSFNGDKVLGANVVEIDIPEGATGLLLNANTADVKFYDIQIEPIGIISDVDSLKKEVEALNGEGGTDKEIIICPKELYTVVGEEFNLYYDSLIKGMDCGLDSPKGIYIDIQCPTLQNASNGIGVRRERMWQITGSKLTSQYVGKHPLQITAYNSNGIIINRKTVDVVVSERASFGVIKNILCIGDSLTNNGPIVATCAEHFSNIGGVQPNFIGQRTTSGFKHEGYPGYTFGSFVTSGSANAYFIFDIPEGTSVSVGDTYSTNGSTYNVTDIRTEGQDNALRLRCTRSGSTMPSSTGTLTKVSGTSSSPSSINYSAFEAETGNPFWDTETSSVNFTKYREKMGMVAEKFDVVVIMLGTNDCIGNIKSSMLPNVDNAKTLINAILSDAADYPTKIILQITPADANTISSWQVYSDIMGDGRKIGYWTNLWNLRNLLYEEFTKEEWNSKVFLGQAALGLDRYYGYPYTEIVSSNRISNVKEIYHTNSVHPNTEGYKQLGDGYFLQIKGLIS